MKIKWIFLLYFGLPVLIIAGVVVVSLLVDLKTLSLNSPFNPIVYTTQQQIKKVDRWQPKGRVESSLKIPENKARAVLLMELETEKIIYEKNSEEQLPAASLSKLMTATVALQMSDREHSFEVTKEATACGEAVMGLTAGENCNLEELIYGLILPSGNDAAEILARNISPKGRQEFISWMNQKAKYLGLQNSQYFNPTGLDESNGEANLSSAADLAALFYYLKHYFPFFMEVFSAQEYAAQGPGHQPILLYNTAWDFARHYPHLTGGKSGNTGRAGFCLLTTAERDNKKLLLIILGEPSYNDIREDTWALFDYGFEVLEKN